jgi:hypothetical protein
VDCDDGNVQVDPHFYQPPAPYPTLSDPDPTVPDDQCGDLIFDNRTRSFTLIYATAQANESPWKYWWRRGRRADNGNGIDLDSMPRRSVPQYQYDTVTMSMLLKSQYDAITAVLLISSDGGLILNDSAFTSVEAGHPLFDAQNVNVQHWRRKQAAVLNSATVNGLVVTLSWSNQHAGRSIDSTNIYRDASLIAIVGPTAVSYPDTVSGAGTFTYTLKHVSTPHGVLVSADPNSPQSNEIEVTVGTACARLAESTGSPNTWKLSDQYLSAGCSLTLGSNKRYRWKPDAAAAFTAWSSDTLYDFLGHSGTGARMVILEDSTVGTNQNSSDTLTFGVGSDRVVLTGPGFVSDKLKKTYIPYVNAAPTLHVGHWYQRFDDGWQWYSLISTDEDTITRIWPMGDYTVELRQHKLQSGTLHRGRRHIIVCSNPGCEANAPPALAPAPAQPGLAWGLFGAGPWISWGAPAQRNALRLYDLWGMPERETAFSEAPWLDGTGGRITDAATGWDLAWTPRDLRLPDVRAFDFSVAGAGLRPYTFGMAVDPDLGLNAADDVASYDASRGLILVMDGSRALGFLLRQGDKDALASAQEYGVGRWAPTTTDYAWAAQRAAGAQLVGTPRDVQLVLSARETVGAGAWQFVVIRGASAASVRARADAVLGALR